MKKQLLFRRFPAVLLALLTVLMLALLPACGGMTTRPMGEDDPLVQENGTLLVEDGSYSTPEKVAEYLHFYGHLPQNYLTKQEAKALGWAASQGNLWEVAEGKSIGGDRFGNREGLLPEADGRTWYECDVNYMGGFRGAERLLYSSDGLIYYTDDHYASFATVYKGNIIKNLIMDCQSYTKYRPNETTGGIFVSWRRKEELPTGA